jgi:hypothetical protein
MSDDETDPTGSEQPDAAVAAPAPPGAQPELRWAPPASVAVASGRGRTARLFASALTAWIVAGVLALAVVGLSVALALGNSGPIRFAPIVRPAPAPGTVPTPVTPGSSPNPSPFGGRLNLGVAGTVTSVGSGTFSVKGVGGQTVTVDEESATIYEQGAAISTAAAVTTGSRVLVLGTRRGAVVKATRVVILPAGLGGFGQTGGGAFSGPPSN